MRCNHLIFNHRYEQITFSLLQCNRFRMKAVVENLKCAFEKQSIVINEYKKCIQFWPEVMKILMKIAFSFFVM